MSNVHTILVNVVSHLVGVSCHAITADYDKGLEVSVRTSRWYEQGLEEVSNAISAHEGDKESAEYGLYDYTPEHISKIATEISQRIQDLDEARTAAALLGISAAAYFKVFQLRHLSLDDLYEALDDAFETQSSRFVSDLEAAIKDIYQVQ